MNMYSLPALSAGSDGKEEQKTRKGLIMLQVGARGSRHPSGPADF